MQVVSLKLPDDLALRLDAETRRRHISKSEFIRVCIEATVNQEMAVADGPSVYDCARDLCGKQRGGPKDLATNPEHLKGFGQ
jgi:hypothetical protein